MRKFAVLFSVAFAMAGGSVLWAQDGADEMVRPFCDPTDAARGCPGEDCSCVDDRLEIVFAGQLENSTLNIETFTANMEVQSHVVLDVASDQIRGYSFGVAHDEAFAGIRPGPAGLNTVGTPSEMFAGQGFTALGLVAGGYRMAVVLSFAEPVVLPVQRATVVNATYTLLADPGAAGTVVRFSEDLGMPATQIVLTIDKLSFPEMGNGVPPFEEVACNDMMDNDMDMLTDGEDPDCIVRNSASRVPTQVVDGVIRTGGGGTPMEVCTPGSGDEDMDGMADCDDPDCAADPACVGETPEDCTPGSGDEDMDGMADCDDTDCAADPACVGETPEDCTPGSGDEDMDGMADCDDPDCAADPACVPGSCPDYGLYFGPEATEADVAVTGTTYPISMRNVADSSGYQLGVKVTTEGDTSTWEFSDSLGGNPNVLVELLIADADAQPQDPETPNKATSAAFTVTPGSITVAQGSAISFAEQGDLLLVDTITETSGVGGPGFTVGYVADINGDDVTNVIPMTQGEGCPVNEVLVVTLAEGPGPGDGEPFSRGDADGNGRVNVIDAILIIQSALGNLPKRFDCDDMLDANDDGTLDVVDGVPPLRYVFQRGEPLPDPFRSCGADGTADDALSCNVSNCATQ